MSTTPQPDRLDAPRHAALKATWQSGQKWETLVEGATIWTPVETPLWAERQEYRRVDEGRPQ